MPTQRKKRRKAAATKTSSSLVVLGFERVLESDVMLRGKRNVLALGLRNCAANFSGNSHDQAAGRDFRALRNQRARGDDAPRADSRAVEDDAAHADQAIRLDRAAMEDDAMAHRYVVADGQRMFSRLHVEYRAVLNAGARADANRMAVTAQHGAGPDA